MPSITRVLRTAGNQFPEIYRRSQRFLLSAAAVAVINLILLAPAFFRLVYDVHADAGWMAQALAIGLWFSLVQRLSQGGAGRRLGRAAHWPSPTQ